MLSSYPELLLHLGLCFQRECNRDNGQHYRNGLNCCSSSGDLQVEILRATVAEKDLFINELLDRIAAAESKVTTLGLECVTVQSEPVKTRWLMWTRAVNVLAASSDGRLLLPLQNNAKRVETKDVGVGCDLPVRYGERAKTPTSSLAVTVEAFCSEVILYCCGRPETQPPDDLQATQVRWSPRLSNRMESSLLRYSPKQYSLMLQSRSSQTTSAGTSPVRSAGDPKNPAQPSPPQQTSVQPPPGPSVQGTAHPPPSNPGTTSSPAEPFSPIKKLFDITEHTEAEWLTAGRLLTAALHPI